MKQNELTIVSHQEMVLISGGSMNPREWLNELGDWIADVLDGCFRWREHELVEIPQMAEMRRLLSLINRRESSKSILSNFSYFGEVGYLHFIGIFAENNFV